MSTHAHDLTLTDVFALKMAETEAIFSPVFSQFYLHFQGSGFFMLADYISG